MKTKAGFKTHTHKYVLRLTKYKEKNDFRLVSSRADRFYTLNLIEFRFAIAHYILFLFNHSNLGITLFSTDDLPFIPLMSHQLDLLLKSDPTFGGFRNAIWEIFLYLVHESP